MTLSSRALCALVLTFLFALVAADVQVKMPALQIRQATNSSAPSTTSSAPPSTSTLPDIYPEGGSGSGDAGGGSSGGSGTSIAGNSIHANAAVVAWLAGIGTIAGGLVAVF